MVAESMFGSVQYGDVKVRFAPAPQPDGAYYYSPPSDQNPNDSLQMPLLEMLAPPMQEPAGEQQHSRKQRDLTQSTHKDDSYWDRRRRNNEAAKRSREKRRFNDMILESRVAELTKDNFLLRAQLNTIRNKFGIIGENHIDVEQVLAQLPSAERMLGFNKRSKSVSAAGLLQLSGGSAAGHTVESRPGSAGTAPPFEPNLPPAAAAPAVYRQQSLHELHRLEPHQPWRPRSADAEQRLTPDFSAAVNLTKPAGEPRVASPAAELSSLPLKLRHKMRLGALSVQVKEEPHDSASSGDDRDSAMSDCGSGSLACKRRRSSASEPPAEPQAEPPAEPASGQIRSQLERLSSEVATLRSLLSQQRSVDV